MSTSAAHQTDDCVLCGLSLDDHWLGSCPDTETPSASVAELARAHAAGGSLPTFREALKLTGEEYSYRRSDFGGYMLLSRGADGGMHYRGDAKNRTDAERWSTSQARDFATRIAAGEVTGTLLFWGGAGWYIG